MNGGGGGESFFILIKDSKAMRESSEMDIHARGVKRAIDE